MLYCERCHTVYDDACPMCHKHDGRPVQPDDLCYFTEQGDLWSSVLEDVFRQAGVPCVRRLSVGVAPYVGANLARYRFYAPYERLEDAMQLCAEMLEPVEDTDADDTEPVS